MKKAKNKRRVGNQKPTFERVGDYAYTLADEVIEMFEEEGGATFYPAQKYELELMLARKQDGSPAALTISVAKPRQNGKSYSARYYAVYMGDFEHKQVLYSAHHSTTTNKMFKAVCDLFESPEKYPEFAKDVKSISHARGYEGIYFKDWKDENGNIQPGGSIEFATRTNSGARGGTYSVIIIDEAQELTDEQQDGMLPVISAASEVTNVSMLPQQIFIGTPPNPNCRGTVFSKMHEKAHSDEYSEAWWLEWSINSSTVEAFEDIKKVLDSAYRTNPAMGYRIAEKTVINEFETMALDGFYRERLGWWPKIITQKIDYAIEEKVWDACRSEEERPSGKTAYGVKFSVDGSEVCLCGAVVPENKPARISLIERKSLGEGIRWLGDWLNERYSKASCVVIDGKNGADVLVDRIVDVWRMKGSIIRPSTKDIIASVGNLTNALNEREVTWYFGQEMLRDSAITSTKRPIAGGWGFGGSNSTPIEAAALAFWGAKTSKRDPNRKMRIG